MLVLTRRTNEVIHIGGDIRVTVVRIDGNRVRLGINAPTHVHIRRDELPDQADGAAGAAPAAAGPDACASDTSGGLSGGVSKRALERLDRLRRLR